MTDYKNYEGKKVNPDRDSLFKKKKVRVINEKNSKVSSNLERDSLLKTHDSYQKTFTPALKAKDPKTFSFYGSAERYYEDAAYRILGDYAFDGTQEEVIQWHTSSSPVTVAIAKQWWPRSKGSVSFNYSEILDFYAGPQMLSKDTPPTRLVNIKTGLEFNPSKGNTVEFWLNKKAFSTNTETIFDIGTHGDHVASHEKAQFKLQLSKTAGKPFLLTYLSGTTGATNLELGSSDVTKDTIADGKWHHYAIAVQQVGSNLNVELYIDGKHDVTQKTAAASMGSIDFYMGGAIGGGNNQTTGDLSASLDDFRYWVGRRNGREIGRFFDHRVYASDIRNEDPQSRLGLYYKFNEGETKKLSKDSKVLDYSGNNIIGEIKKYTTSTRLYQSAIDLSENSTNTEVGDLIIYDDNVQVMALRQELAKIGQEHDLNNQNTLAKFLPNWATDRHGDQSLNSSDDFAILMHLLATQFDEIKLKIDSIRRNTGILMENSEHDILSDTIRYQSSGSQFVDNNVLGCSTEDELDIIYPGNRIDFPMKKLEDLGFEVTVQPIVSAASVEEEVDQKTSDIRLLMSPQQVSNVILDNVYSAATHFIRKKGTIESANLTLAPFGIDKNLVSTNIYSNNSKLFLDNSKKEIDTLKVKSVFFGDNPDATLFLKSNDNNSRSFIEADSQETEYTFEGTFIFPEKSAELYTVLDSSIFGLHRVAGTNNNLNIATPDNASLQVSVVKDSKNSNDAKFVLSSTSGLFSAVETSVKKDVYESTSWNLALKISKDVDNKFIELGDPPFKVELVGHNYVLDYLKDSFHISASITNAQYNAFKGSHKTVFIGAHRTDITGSVLKKTDIKFVNFNAWNDSLEIEELQQRAMSPSYYGRINPSFGKDNFSNYNGSSAVESPNKMFKNRILSIESNDTVEISATNTVDFIDYSSGSYENRFSYGNQLGYSYDFSSVGFSSKTDNVVQREFLPYVKDIPLGNILSDDGVSVKQSELDRYLLSNQIETPIISFEKSMYSVITKEIINFLSGVKALNNLIGEPADKYRQRYKSLDHIKREFFSFVENDIEFERFVRYYKWINKAIGKFLEQIVPASSFTNAGIEDVIESHMLERNKYDHKLPTLEYKEPKLVGQLLGINELLYDWEHGHVPLNTVPYRRPAKSLKFDQSGSPLSYVLVPDNDVFTMLNGSDNAPFTMAAWIRPSNQDSTRVILSKFHHDTDATANEWEFFLNGRRLFFTFQHGPTGNQWAFNSSVNVLSDTLNTWQHVAVTFDKTSVKFYVNGSLTNTTTGTKDAGFTTTTNTPAVLLIGQKFTGSSIGFRGQMRDVVYIKHGNTESPFNDSQIAELYNNGHSWDLQEHSRASEIDAWWPLGAEGDVEDETMRDNSGNNHHGTPSSPTSFVLESGLLYETQILSEKNNCLWWKDRAIRGSDNTPVHSSDSNRETLRVETNRVVSGSTYVLRKLVRPYKYSVDRQHYLTVGSNPSTNKIKNFYNIVNHGHDIAISSSGTQQTRICSDDIQPNKKTRFAYKADTSKTSGYMDGDIDLLMPFSLYTSSVDNNLSLFAKGMALTNNHDKFGALQGPFVSEILGRHPHQNVKFGTPKNNRPEAYDMEVTNNLIKISKPTNSAISYVRLGPGGAPFYNIKNVKNVKSDNHFDRAIGNYRDEYEIVQIHGRSQNNNYLVETEGAHFSNGFRKSNYIADLIDHPTPNSGSFKRDRRSHVITNRFSAIGTADSAGAYGKDRTSEEFSVYNTVNYRNSTVRDVYNLLSSEKSKKFGYRPVTSVSASPHKTYRNAHDKTNSQGAKYDNFFVQHQIPRNDFGYSWISASAFCSVDDFVKRNAGRGHQHTFGISGSTATGFLESSQTINFLTASVLGLRKQTNTPLLFGLELGYLDTLTSDAVFIDFAGLNSIILDPIDTEQNTLGNSFIEATRGTGTNELYLDINYVNSTLSRERHPFNSFAQSSVKDRDVSRALVLNGIILNRQGPYGWPTWKQIRGDQHPITRAHRKDNTLSISFRNSRAFPSPHPGTNFDYQNTIVDNETKASPRSVKNYKEIMVTSKFKPLSVSFHPTDDETMIEFLDPNAEVPLHIPQVDLQKMWFNDQHFHNYIKQENRRTGESESPSFNYRIALQNTITSFANSKLVEEIDYKETPITQAENNQKLLKILSNSNPLYIKEMNYIETVYPREINTYTKNARIRQNYDFFGWKSRKDIIGTDTTPSLADSPDRSGEKYPSSHSKIGRQNFPRDLILSGNIKYSNTFLISNSQYVTFKPATPRIEEVDYKKCFFNSYDVIDINSTGSRSSLGNCVYITASTWVLDSRKSFGQPPININNSFAAGDSTLKGENFLEAFRSRGLDRAANANPFASAPSPDIGRAPTELTFLVGYPVQGIRSEGLLQNDYSLWPLGYNGLRGMPPYSPVYNRRIPQFADGWTNSNVVVNSKSGEFLAGEARWSAADNLEIGPFYDTYEEFAEETRLVGQDYSLVPEFTISKFIEDIYKSEDYFEAAKRDDFLQLTGALYHSSSGEISIGSQFFKTYSNSDFMKYFKPVKEQLSETNPDMDAGRLTLRCQAVKRLLPYRGFYPAERTVQINEIFSRNYLATGTYSESYRKNTEINKQQARDLLKLRIENTKALSMRPLFAPGILYNSIKSGVAVDYPVIKTSYESHLESTFDAAKKVAHGIIGGFGFMDTAGGELGYRGSALNNTNDTGIPRLYFSDNEGQINRVTFDDMLNPERLWTMPIHDSEPHPSASLLYGSSQHLKVLERPASFGSLNVEKTQTRTSMVFGNTRAGFQRSMMPYKSAIQNFTSETVKFFLRDESLTTILSEPKEPFLQSGVNYKMRVYLVNNRTTMYDRHSAFGPPVHEGDITYTRYESTKVGATTGLHTNIRLTFKTGSTDFINYLTGTAQLPAVHLTDKDNNTFTFKFFNKDTFSPDPTHTSNVRYVQMNTGVAQKNALRFVAAATGSSMSATFTSSAELTPRNFDVHHSVQISSSGDPAALTNEAISFTNGGIRETVFASTTDVSANRISSNGSLSWAGGSGTAGTAEFEVTGGGSGENGIKGLENDLASETLDDDDLPELTVVDPDGRTIKVRLYANSSTSLCTHGGGLCRSAPSNISGVGNMDGTSGNAIGIAYVDILDTDGNFLSSGDLRDDIVTAINSVHTPSAASGGTGYFGLTISASSVAKVGFQFKVISAEGSADIIGQNGMVSGGNFTSGHPLSGTSVGTDNIVGAIGADPFDNATTGTQTLTIDIATNAATKTVLDRVTSESNLPSIVISDGRGSSTPAHTFKFYSSTGISSPSTTDPNTSFVAVSGTPATDAASFRTAITDVGSGLNVTAGGSSSQVIVTDQETGSETTVTTSDGVNDIIVDPRTTILTSTPSWTTGIASDTTFASAVAKSSTFTKQDSHGFLPFVPPFLDPNTRPYVELSFTPTQNRTYTIPEIIDSMTETYYNIDAPSNVDTKSNNVLVNRNYHHAMCLSASINFKKYVRLQADNYRVTDNRAIIPDSNTDKIRWLIQPKWETPVLDFTKVAVDALRVPTGSTVNAGAVDKVYGSPWKRRYQTDYYSDGAQNRTDINYFTSSTGMWHQRGQIIPENSDKGYHLVVQGGIQNLSTREGDLARECGFVDSSRSTTSGKATQSPFVSKRIGVLSKDKIISEAVVAIPYYLTDDCKMRLFPLDGEMVEEASAYNLFEKNNYEAIVMNSDNEQDANMAKKRYEAWFDSPSQFAVHNVAYQLRMMEKYILPIQFDFRNNDDIPEHVQYIFQFKSRLTEQDLADIWQNLYPTSKEGIAVSGHSAVSEDKEISDVEYISGFLNTKDIPVLNNRKSNYANPREFLDNEVRWLVFKAKYRSEKYYDNLVGSSVSKLSSEILEVDGHRPERGVMKVNEERKFLTQFGYNWPYDYFSLVELIKLDSKVDFYSNINRAKILNLGSLNPQGIANLGGLTQPEELVPVLTTGVDAPGSQITSELIADSSVFGELVKDQGVTGGTTFNATNAQVRAGTEQVFVNGVQQTLGAGKDYTISGNKIVFNYTVKDTDVVRISYLKQE
tara:strand:- start:30174 stop:42269 length:12096 start_codon:yes stop_codon:yes gene_type:complete